MMNKSFSLLILVLLFSCNQKIEKPTFSEWNKAREKEISGNFDYSKVRTKIITSENFKIDTIYRSMMGPISEQTFQLADSGDLVWLVGYSVEVLDSNGLNELSPELMCHNNLNLTTEREFPWNAEHFKYVNRIFTLTQGFTNLNLPDGFGIPFPAEQNFKAIFQALNHNNPSLDTSIVHRVTLKYFLDSEINFELKALTQNTVWLIKQYEGPPGLYGEPPVVQATNDSSKNVIYHSAQQPSCGVDMLANNPLKTLDLYYDKYGRKYTGHWKIAPGKEEMRFNATKLLNLQADKTLYYASAHVHPYCEYLELRDITKNELVFRTEMKSIANKIGLEYITDFTSNKGVELFKDHEYELVSYYNNTSTDTLSAMSVVYLYTNY